MAAFGVIESCIQTWSLDAPRYNIAPSTPGAAGRLTKVPIVREIGGTREIIDVVWPLIPPWERGRVPKYSTANARAETVADKPAFAHAWRKQQRALFPISGYYEWRVVPGRTAKQPFHVFRKDHRMLAAAGVWDVSTTVDGVPVVSAAILTCPPNELCAEIHNRMPVFIADEEYSTWLAGEVGAAAKLMRPYPAALMAMEPISTRVNNPNYDDVSILART